MSNLTLLAQVTTTDTGDQHGMVTGLIAWLFIGLVAGFLGSKIVNKSGDGLILDIILGLVGSFVGGFLFSLLGIHAGGSLIGSIVVATIGAIIVLVVYHKVIRGNRTA